MVNPIFKYPLTRKLACYILGLVFVKEVKNWPTIYLDYLGISQTKLKLMIFKNGFKFYFRDYFDAWEIKGAYIDKKYFLFGKPKKNDIVIDIGAHIGAFSILAASLDNSIEVYSFEPSDGSFDLLKKNIKANKLRNIKSFKFGIAGKKEKKKLYNLLSPNVNSFFKTSQYLKSNSPLSFTEVECLGLKDIFIQNKIKKCDFLKMDCEGAEYEIFLNLPIKFLKRIKLIALEYHNGYSQFSHQDLVNLLKKHGFAVKVVFHQREENIGYIYAKQREKD